MHHRLFKAHSLPPLACAVALATAAGQTPIPTAPAPVKVIDRDYVGWLTHCGNASHQATSPVISQPLQQILWTTPVDLAPQYTGPNLLIHYGSPLCTNRGTVIVPVKTGPTDGFQVEGRRVRTGQLLWTLVTDYTLPPHGWTPICGPTLQPFDRLAVPAAGGTVLLRSSPDSATGAVSRAAFYGLSNYLANQSAYDQNVVISTPITADSKGNLFFGFLVMGSTPVPLQSGIARIAWNGSGSWVAASTAAGDPSIQRVVYNCAPALGLDDTCLYVAVTTAVGSGFGAGYLLKLDSTTLAQQGIVRLKDNANPTLDAYLPDDGSACPTVGPDGDVYFGVLEYPFGSNNLRGWMRHFDGALLQTKPTGAFGWDDTCSIVPRSAVPSYAGTSPYLVLTKYNNYGGIGSGTGLNKLAVLDPNAQMIDPISGATVMNEVLTVLGPTPDPNWPGGVREWCINTAAIDVGRQSALVNCEDGILYRWSFVTNTLVEAMPLTVGIGEAYTSTIVGSDGTVFATNNAILFAVGR